MIDILATNGQRSIMRAANDERTVAPQIVLFGSSEAGSCHFSTYQAERVSVTSALWSGGDWHWRLTGPSGGVLADCGGYVDEAQCLAVITALRLNAQAARPPLRH